jgi:hypothetical protein
MKSKNRSVLLFFLLAMASGAGLQTAKGGVQTLQIRPALAAGGDPEWQSFDKAAFYHIMASGDLDAVNDELNLLSEKPSPERSAYEGALLMRKAGLLAMPGEKLRSFKAGRIKLESALVKDSANVEYHFLRLIIQEHAPGIVKYSKELQKDGSFIRQNFKALPAAVQNAIIDYSKHSKTLRPEDFDPKKN